MSKDLRRGVVGILAVLYGVGVAFGSSLIDNETFWKAWLLVGAFVLGVSWITLMVLPRVRAQEPAPR